MVTHPRVLDPPSPASDALDAIGSLLESGSVRVISPGDRYWPLLRETILESGARGNMIMDAQIVAVCREHGASKILTEDRDFARFRGISTQRLP